MAGRDGSTTSTALRELEVRHNEELVRAQSALVGERRIAWVRIAMFVTFAITQEGVARALHRQPPFDLPRMIAVVLYAIFAVGSIVTLRRVEPNVRRATIIPLVTSVVDAGFLAFQGIRGWQIDGVVHPEMGAISMGLVLCFSVARFRWYHVAWSTFLSIAAYVSVIVVTHTFDPIASPFVLGGFVALGFMIALTNRAIGSTFTDLRRRDNLSRFLPQQIVDRVIKEGQASLRPTQCHATVLFSDLRDFTTLSESMAPREVLEFLDEYFGHMVQIVKGHDGVVNKFLGDGMLAFWGVPDRVTDHADRAVAAALDMRRRVVELNEDRVKRGLGRFRIGIGVHTGLVAAGMLGGADQHEYTIIGDAVNVASRIEGLTKPLGHDVLVSETTWDSLGGARPHGTRISEAQVKGRKEPVVVYAVDGA